ncbi:hypothetical protein MSG28_013299 [Choristoneura fumiferana]|uniref:Uncharacterized protein n=1 Tax=Choristoneura fumiferana TaxID=7141 RepID=A0ACC0KTC9_CHOFU|nr:hypothetical protein MSG28_013299 [Choristoneura fumiferana]
MEHRARRAHGAKKKESKESKDDKIIILVNEYGDSGSPTPFKVFLSFHSYFELIIFPWGYKKDPCPDYLNLMEAGIRMARAIHKSSGMTYKVGSTKDLTYYACGTATDWSYSVAKIPYSFMIELPSKKNKFKLPRDKILSTCEESWNGVQSLMEYVDVCCKVTTAAGEGGYSAADALAKEGATGSTAQEDYFCHHEAEENVHQPLPSLSKAFYVLKISNSAASNASVWMDAGIHAREWIAPAVATYIANHFARNFKDLPTTIDIWKEEPCGMDILVEGPRVKQVSCMLRERCIPYCVAISDVDAMKERERCHIRKASSSCPMDWKNYHRLDTIYAFLDRLACEYPYLCTVCCIGRSYEGRDLKLLKISNGSCNNEGVWLDGAIHAREYILPVMNPDGYEFTHTCDRMWRKNRAHYGECVGVDLNRNFSFGWGEKGEEGSSEDPGNIFYRGPKPFSECESIAVKRKILECGSRFKVFLSFHSYGEVIIFPWATLASPVQTMWNCSKEALPWLSLFTHLRPHVQGRQYKDLMYYAAGTSIDWAYGCANIPYSYMVELRSKEHRFLLPKEEILCTSSEIFCGVLKISNSAASNASVWMDAGIHAREWIAPAVATYIANHFARNFKDLPTNVMYGASGTSNDWSYGAAKIPFCYLLELRSKKHRFKVPQEEIEETGNEILKGVMALMERIRGKAIDIWKEEPCGMDILVEGPRVKQVSCMLRERCIPYCVAISDVDAMKERERCHIRKASSSCPMDWKNYHRLDTIYAFLDRLACEYPYLCTVCCIGRSYEGRDLKLLKISNGSCNNEGVWLDGAIHAREWISAAVVTYIADQLVRNFNCARKSVTIMNPDGYEFTHTCDRIFGWGEKGEEGSSEDPGNIFYRGPKPFSECESIAVKRKILECGSRFKVFLSFHSYGEVIIFPWGYTGEPCSDYVELLEGGTAMAKSIYNTCGHTYKVGSTKDLMYYAAGTSIDWAYGCANIPYSYMVELRSKEHRFLLPKEEILCTSSEIFCGVKTLMSFVDRRCAPVRRTSSCCSFKSICSRE